jgi:ADP-ribose pyrophosphatase YjhB (NUDIX family)
MLNRISAIIIKRKKLLLVTGYEESFYWTPGGKLNKNETYKSALARELKEELAIKLKDIKPYSSYEAFNEITKKKQKVNCYLISYTGIPKPKGEITRIFWYSKQNFNKKYPKISKGIEKYLIPQLIKDSLL